MTFDGATYNAQLDQVRLTSQLARVMGIMLDGDWRTLSEVARITHDPETSISARLRDLRKEKFGRLSPSCRLHVERRRRGDGKRGLFEYRLTVEEK